MSEQTTLIEHLEYHAGYASSDLSRLMTDAAARIAELEADNERLRGKLVKAREIMRFVDDVVWPVENDQLGDDDCYRVGVFEMSNLHGLVADYRKAEADEAAQADTKE